ncbi:hypothetical protein Acr_15g0010490 [Actinidia rufa]|uniref:Uncharacterized protein n=1 Tax=Actinidia rufa TaxID=165716 RepID=A0A7J0FUT7_9ERIC|nr:hypothetical protein Acr_15g0010490 [Actinidia rufa]
MDGFRVLHITVVGLCRAWSIKGLPAWLTSVDGRPWYWSFAPSEIPEIPVGRPTWLSTFSESEYG